MPLFPALCQVCCTIDGIIESRQDGDGNRLSTTGISQASAVKVLVESARKRRFFVLAIEQLALALTLVSAGAILLLLLGTQILAWYWLLLLAALGVGIAAYRIHARLASTYTVAQVLDRRLSLHDSLSTAWFLLTRPEGVEQPGVRYQLEYAEQIARGVDPVTAFPFTGQRVWAVAGAVAAVAFGLFALRYMVTDSLNLRNALLPVHRIAEVFERVEKALGVQPHSAPNPDSGDQRSAAIPQNNDKDKTAQQDHPNAEELKTSKAEGVTPPDVPMVPTETPQDSKHPQDAKSENQEGPASAGERKSSEKGQTPNSQQANGQKGAESPKDQGKDQQNANQNADQQNSVGAMDRVKEAISSLMAKMRPSSGAQKQQSQQQQNDKSSEGQQASSQAKGDKDQSAEAQKNGSDQQSSEEKSADAQAQGQTTEKAQSAQGHSSDKSADKSNSEAHSGVGRQDGDKSIAEREQLKAMGKLAEIIGKRSADLTGDVMIENPSGKQQLKTDYSQRMGNHADLGGEINRDEISPADQQYVREYMEEVRKLAKPSPK
jgi:hypothetical protein